MKHSWLYFIMMVLTGLPLAGHSNQEQASWHQHRFRNMVEQKLDMSCGAASLSALMMFYARVPMTEANLLALLEKVIDKKEQDSVLQNGFSLLHLKKAVATKGLELKAANIYNAQLVRFGSPALLQLKTRQGYHFVLWHGKVNGRHWLGDPSRGDLWLSDHELEQEWTGIAAWLFENGTRVPQATKQQLQAAYASR